MRILGYQASRPNLRLLRLPEEVVEPSPVPVNARIALDHGFARDGWLVFMPGQEVRGVPVPLEGKAFRVGRWWDCVPAPNPRTIWLANADVDDEHAPTVVAEYDGVRREELARRELAPGLRLDAASSAGLVLRPPDHGPPAGGDVLLLWPWQRACEPLGPGWHVLACHGSLLAVEHRNGELTLLDAATRVETPIARPLPGGWNSFASFSPDGTRVAIGIDEEDAEERTARMVAPLPELRSLDDIGAWIERITEPQHAAALERFRKLSRQPRWTRLALIDAATGAVRLAEGHFDNFASAPLWSADSRWLIFDAPFDKSLFACDTGEPQPRLTPVLRRRGRPVPRIDVTAITRNSGSSASPG